MENYQSIGCWHCFLPQANPSKSSQSGHLLLVEKKTHKLLTSVQSSKYSKYRVVNTVVNTATVEIQLMFIIHEVCICAFACWLKFETPKSTLTSLLWLFMDICRAVKNSNSQHPHSFLAEVKEGHPPFSCFSSQTINKHSFHGLFSATFFHLLCFWLVVSV